MMGYTHIAVGAAGSIAFAALMGNSSPALYLVAMAGGALGGVAIDIDTKDHESNPKVTDASRSRFAVILIIAVSVVLDLTFKLGIIQVIIQRKSLALGGFATLSGLLLIGYATDHRTFSHSLLFVLLTSTCICFILPAIAIYYAIGCVLHILLDMFNNKYHNHGIWLFYPIKIGTGIALGLCKAARVGNKIIYFLGIGSIVIATNYYFKYCNNYVLMLPSIILMFSLFIVLHFVRIKSEKEQRHIMHINGEL